MTQNLAGKARPRNLPKTRVYLRQTCSRCGRHDFGMRYLPVANVYICDPDCTKEAT